VWHWKYKGYFAIRKETKVFCCECFFFLQEELLLKQSRYIRPLVSSFCIKHVFILISTFSLRLSEVCRSPRSRLTVVTMTPEHLIINMCFSGVKKQKKSLSVNSLTTASEGRRSLMNKTDRGHLNAPGGRRSRQSRGASRSKHEAQIFFHKFTSSNATWKQQQNNDNDRSESIKKEGLSCENSFLRKVELRNRPAASFFLVCHRITPPPPNK